MTSKFNRQQKTRRWAERSVAFPADWLSQVGGEGRNGGGGGGDPRCHAVQGAVQRPAMTCGAFAARSQCGFRPRGAERATAGERARKRVKQLIDGNQPVLPGAGLKHEGEKGPNTRTGMRACHCKAGTFHGSLGSPRRRFGIHTEASQPTCRCRLCSFDMLTLGHSAPVWTKSGMHGMSLRRRG
eukprot:362070-Chlamydomonas_euryale.AAC.6